MKETPLQLDEGKELGLKLAPPKTWPIKSGQGRVSKGFNFLGYQISPYGISIAQRALSSMMTNYTGTTAQGATKKRLVDYVKRWMTWAAAGVSLIDAPLKLKNKKSILQDNTAIHLSY